MFKKANMYLRRHYVSRLTPKESEQFKRYICLLLCATWLSASDNYVQHGNTSCLLHSVAVAYYGLLLARFFHSKCDRKNLVVGSLLHDYFLYDWHDSSHEFHGFVHPSTACHNAERDFGLNDVEKDMIKKHMFPLTPIPPRYKESYILCFIDKVCSVYETFSKVPYPALQKKYLDTFLSPEVSA